MKRTSGSLKSVRYTRVSYTTSTRRWKGYTVSPWGTLWDQYTGVKDWSPVPSG